MSLNDVTIQWTDVNMIEKGHRVYRSHGPMDVDNLPEPIANLEKNSNEYIDKDQVVGETLYYRVSAWIDGYEAISDEVVIEVEPLVPGPQSFIGGDLRHGFFGEVSANDFITGDELASRIGLTAGTSFNSDTEWLKFALNDEIIFVPKKPYRYNLSWNDINNAGTVYERQNTIVSISGFDFRVTLLRGANSDPCSGSQGNDLSYTHGSEWNKLMYPIHSGVHTSSIHPSNPSEPYNQWASYSDADLGIALGNGRGSWTQESNASGSGRLIRGSSGVSHTTGISPSGTHASYGWRPALRLVR